jgi:hypothetical protein
MLSLDTSERYEDGNISPGHLGGIASVDQFTRLGVEGIVLDGVVVLLQCIHQQPIGIALISLTPTK